MKLEIFIIIPEVGLEFSQIFQAQKQLSSGVLQK